MLFSVQITTLKLSNILLGWMNMKIHIPGSLIQTKYKQYFEKTKRQKILESWATPNWSKRSVGQEESRSEIPSPRSSIPDPEFLILNSNSQVPGPRFQIPKHVKFG